MNKIAKGWKGLIAIGLMVGFMAGNVASARPTPTLAMECGYLGWLIGGLHSEAGLQAQVGSPNAGQYVAVAKYYTNVAYNYAVAGYYIGN